MKNLRAKINYKKHNDCIMFNFPTCNTGSHRLSTNFRNFANHLSNTIAKLKLYQHLHRETLIVKSFFKLPNVPFFPFHYVWQYVAFGFRVLIVLNWFIYFRTHYNVLMACHKIIIYVLIFIRNSVQIH